MAKLESIPSDLSGQRYGRLTVLRFSHVRITPNGRFRMYLCRCDCGKETTVSHGNLRSGNVRSCGCFKREVSFRHGWHGTPEYHVWDAMLRRCTNPQDASFPGYGGRGITVCSEWRDFANFIRDMGPRPSAGHSIERVDVNGPYSIANCVWATATEQMRNTRRNRWVTFNGETLTLAEWSERTGIGYVALQHRLDRGWSAERALTEPVRKKRAA